MSKLPYYKLSEKAEEPKRATIGSAGIDLQSVESITIPAKGRGLVHTGLRFDLPEGTYGRIAPRSGLAKNNGIDVGGGVIDSDYTGEVCVILFNHDEHDFQVQEGMRIAQLIVEKYMVCTPYEVKLKQDDEDEPKEKQARMSCSGWHRGHHGFGSTGLQ